MTRCPLCFDKMFIGKHLTGIVLSIVFEQILYCQHFFLLRSGDLGVL